MSKDSSIDSTECKLEQLHVKRLASKHYYQLDSLTLSREQKKNTSTAGEILRLSKQ